MPTTAFENYFPFSSGPGASATDARWRLMARRFLLTGVVKGYLNQLHATIVGTTITVDTGACWIDGYYAENLSTHTFSTGGSNGLMVAQLDHIGMVVNLAFNAGEVVPVQTTDLYEIVLGTVTSSGTVITDGRTLVNNASNLDVAPLVTATTPTQFKCRVWRNAAWLQAVGVSSALTWDKNTTPGYDPSNMLPGGSSTNIVIPAGGAGDYLVISSLSMISVAVDDYCVAYIYKNGTVFARGTIPISAAIGNEVRTLTTDIVPCVAGDIINIFIFAGFHTMNGLSGPDIAYLSVRRLAL